MKYECRIMKRNSACVFHFIIHNSSFIIRASNRQFLFLLNLAALVHDPGDEDDQEGDEQWRGAQVHVLKGGLQLIINRPISDQEASEGMYVADIFGRKKNALLVKPEQREHDPIEKQHPARLYRPPNENGPGHFGRRGVNMTVRNDDPHLVLGKKRPAEQKRQNPIETHEKTKSHQQLNP